MNDQKYTIRQGDTLYEIARQYKIPVDTIARANGIRDPDVIMTGQILTIPQPTRPNWYVVRYGDSLYTIAKRFFTTVDDLLELNELANPDVIFPGEIIRIR